MTDKEKLIQLIKTGEQCNIDLGVYQWLAQGFNKEALAEILTLRLMMGDFWKNGFSFIGFGMRSKTNPLGTDIFLFRDDTELGRHKVKHYIIDYYSVYNKMICTALDLCIKELAKPE